jgi:hypothetical protein
MSKGIFARASFNDHKVKLTSMPTMLLFARISVKTLPIFLDDVQRTLIAVKAVGRRCPAEADVQNP